MNKAVLSITVTFLVYGLFFSCLLCFMNRKSLVLEDFVRIPKRFFRSHFMSCEIESRIIISEYSKLREFVKHLNIPIREKEYLMYDIDRGEKKAVDTLGESIKNDVLKKIKDETKI